MSGDRFLYERATLWFLVGFGTTIRGGNPRKGSRACQNASVLAAQTGDKILQTQALIQSVQALSWLGEFSLCDQLCHEIELLMEKAGNPALEATYLTVLAALLGGKGHLDEAKRMIQEAQDKVASHGLIYLYPQTLLYELLFKPLEGKYDEAEAVGEQLSQFASSMNALFLKGIARFFLGVERIPPVPIRQGHESGDRSRQSIFPEKRSGRVSCPLGCIDEGTSFHSHGAR